MKANELMIGDFVKIKITQHQTRVTNLAGDSVYTDAAFPIRYDEIEPIPLTSEILEKLFTKKCKRYGIYDDFYDFELHEFNDSMWQAIYHNCEVSSIPDECVNVCFMHELQHFLSHCNIETEIKL